MPRKNSWKVEKVVRRVEELRGWLKYHEDAGKRDPSCRAGMAPHAGCGNSRPATFGSAGACPL